MNAVRGPAVVAALCGRCMVVLVLVNLPGVALVWAVDRDSTLASWLGVFPLVIAVAAIPVALIGFPAGVLLAHLLRHQLDERRHVAAFAGTGAVLAVGLCATLGIVDGSGPWWVVAVAAAEGAVGAGGARWWSGRPRRRRRSPSDEQVEDDVVSRALDG